MGNLKLLEVISLTAFLISLPIYVIFTWILFKHRHTDFSDPFYAFVRSLAIADILILLWTQITWKFPLLGIATDVYLEGGRWLAVCLFAGNVFFTKAGDFILIDLIMNRVTATVFHKRHKKVKPFPLLIQLPFS